MEGVLAVVGKVDDDMICMAEVQSDLCEKKRTVEKFADLLHQSSQLQE